MAQEKDGETAFPIETVIMAAGVRPNRVLVQELRGDDIEFHVIGDVKEPHKALEASYEGFEVGKKL